MEPWKDDDYNDQKLDRLNIDYFSKHSHNLPKIKSSGILRDHFDLVCIL